MHKLVVRSYGREGRSWLQKCAQHLFCARAWSGGRGDAIRAIVRPNGGCVACRVDVCVRDAHQSGAMVEFAMRAGEKEGSMVLHDKPKVCGLLRFACFLNWGLRNRMYSPLVWKCSFPSKNILTNDKESISEMFTIARGPTTTDFK